MEKGQRGDVLFWFCLFFFLLLFRSLCWLLVLGHNSAISHLQVVGGKGREGREGKSEVVMIMVVVMSASANTNLLEEANNK